MNHVVAGAVLIALAAYLATPPTRGARLRHVGPRRGGAVAPAGDALKARSRRRTPWRRRRRHLSATTLAAADVAGLAEQLAALVTAGLSPVRAWTAIAEHGSTPAIAAAGQAVIAAHRRGLSASAAFRAHAVPSPDARPIGDRRTRADPWAAQLAIALDVSESTGAGMAETLQRFANGLRADALAAAEREAALAGPRATATLLAVLPGAGVLLGGAVGARPWRVLVETGPGRLCLLAALGLWTVGRLWTRLLIRRAAAP